MIVTTSMLKEKYREYVNPLDKISRDARDNKIFRIARGIYETDRGTESALLAPVILSPSYLSFDFALSHYGLIPEKVTVISSASLGLGKRKIFINCFGRYEYQDIPAEAFSEGLTFLGNGDQMVRIATKEKAICDSLCKWRTVRNVSELKELLFEDKRIDETEFSSCDFREMSRLAALYRKKNHSLLERLIRKEYNDE